MCVRNDFGRELAQSDSLLTLTFRPVAFLKITYKVTVFICIYPHLLYFLSTSFNDNVHIPYACDTFLTKHVLFNMLTCDFVDIPLFVEVKTLQSLCLSCFTCMTLNKYSVSVFLIIAYLLLL